MKFRNTCLMVSLVVASLRVQAAALECTNWNSLHPEWLWCDDFESDAALANDYFEVDRAAGRFGVSTDAAYGGTAALKGTYVSNSQNAGNIKFSFGRTPVAPTRYTNRDFQEIYWRFYMRVDPQWTGNPAKTSRITIFAGSDWSQAMIGHLWQDSALGLALDPASGVDAAAGSSAVITTGYNDFNHLRWLGILNGKTQVYAPAYAGQWNCVETHVKLNTPGLADGTFEFWVNDDLEAENHALNWRSSYQAYGLNAIFLENYAAGPLPAGQSRYFDNFVVSTSRIGCIVPTMAPPSPPDNVQ